MTDSDLDSPWASHEWSEGFEDAPEDTEDGEHQYLGSPFGRTIGERYAEGGHEIHVHVLWLSDNQFLKHCALFHSANVWHESSRPITEGSEASGGENGEMGTTVLVDIPELVEQ
ncbi:MAG TPA: hypothetical protein VF972_02780, partial [Actinomycetota bacterium]